MLLVCGEEHLDAHMVIELLEFSPPDWPSRSSTPNGAQPPFAPKSPRLPQTTLRVPQVVVNLYGQLQNGFLTPQTRYAHTMSLLTAVIKPYYPPPWYQICGSCGGTTCGGSCSLPPVTPLFTFSRVLRLMGVYT
eukprot:1804641-Pyramimonas_sp.AAC.1